MNSAFEYIALVQREREARFESERIARIAAGERMCCHPNAFDRFARVVRRSSVTCAC